MEIIENKQHKTYYLYIPKEDAYNRNSMTLSINNLNENYKFLLDLKHVICISSNIIGLILKIHKKNLKVVVMNCEESIYDMLEVLHITNIVDCYKNGEIL